MQFNVFEINFMGDASTQFEGNTFSRNHEIKDPSIFYMKYLIALFE